MPQNTFELPTRIHDIGSLVADCKRFSSNPSVEDLWMAYLVRIPMGRTEDEMYALHTWFFKEIEDKGYELFLI